MSIFSDPALDDKEYRGTKALIEAKPLPHQVRVLDAMHLDDKRASQASGDVISALKVDTELNPETTRRERVCVIAPLMNIFRQGRFMLFVEDLVTPT